MIITATTALMGIVPTKSPDTTTSRNWKMLAQNVEMRVRVRAPEASTPIIVWPTTAHPPMPPKIPESMFATP